MLRYFLLGVLWLTAGAVQGQTRDSVKVQWLGHAAFEITSPAGTVLLLDPYLTQNPNTPDSLKRLDATTRRPSSCRTRTPTTSATRWR